VAAELLPIRIAPSILSSDFAKLGEEVARLEAAGADWVHVDVMDGHFVGNLTIGPPVVRALKRVAKIPLDVHIMITDPDRYAKDYCDAGADCLTFHVEAAPDPVKTCEMIRSFGKRAGIAIRPSTPLSPAVERAVAAADLVLPMTVEPGFGGQKFMADQLPKIRRIAEIARARRADVEVDGGVDAETVVACAEAGANAIVAGSFVFKANDLSEPIRKLREGATRGRSKSLAQT
jgi:ribulose-phosphate 3-epimerase